MIYALSYACSLIIFIAFDAVWLGSTSSVFYKPSLGDIMVQNLRLAPAVVFYLIYPIALVIFAVGPALKTETYMTALVFGALFGFFAYATYDLTNYVTLRNWTLQLTVIDTLWGTFASGMASMVAYFAVRTLAPKLGL